jgi:hypothetical protein
LILVRRHRRERKLRRRGIFRRANFLSHAFKRRPGAAGLRQERLNLSACENGIESGCAADAGDARLRTRGRHVNLSLQLALGANNSHRLAPGSADTIFNGANPRLHASSPDVRRPKNINRLALSVGFKLIKGSNLRLSRSLQIDLQAISALMATFKEGRRLANTRISSTPHKRDIKTSTMLKQVKTGKALLRRVSR